MLIEFFGQECAHCIRMAPLVKKLNEELGTKIESLETWHNEENAKKLAEYDNGFCGGVPFFVNTDTGKTVCGEISYDKLKNWAEGR